MTKREGLVFKILHEIHGRVRLHVPTLKGLDARTRQLETELAALAGVTRAVANAATGTVVVEFDTTQTGAKGIIRTLRRGGWVHTKDFPARPEPPMAAPGVKQRVTESLVASVLELAVRGLVSALV